MGGGYGITMALGYAWFDSYDNVGYVLTLHISPHTVCPYLPIAKRAFFFCRVANFNALGRDVLSYQIKG